MKNIDNVIKSLIKEFDNLNSRRETALTLSREIIRLCSKSIRSVHRNQYSDASTYLNEAAKKDKKLKNYIQNIPELRFAGYVIEAEKELVEASIVLEYELTGKFLKFSAIEVSASSFIQGIGDAIGEWRRKALDNLREMNITEGEKYLEIMEAAFEILNELDYPDALTGGLRRYADNARGIIERTRSDITNAVINENLRKELLR
mgnify:CR=1 FL=1